MPDPIAPATPTAPVTPASAAPAVAPAAAPPSSAAPAQTPAAASATPDKPAAAAPSESTKAEEPLKRPDSLLPEIAGEKTAEGEPAKDGEKPKDDAKPADGAPEKYDFKLPEGVKLDPVQQTAFEAFAREKKFDQDTAQALMDRHIGALKRQTNEIYNSWFETQKTWQGEITADKTVGGANLPASKQAIGRVLNHLGPELGKQFREALDFTGAGNNPAVFRGLVKLAERFTEAVPVKGNPGTAAPASGGLSYPSHSRKA